MIVYFNLTTSKKIVREKVIKKEERKDITVSKKYQKFLNGLIKKYPQSQIQGLINSYKTNTSISFKFSSLLGKPEIRIGAVMK